MLKTFERLERHADVAGAILVKSFHLLALFAIGGATVWSAVHAFLGMVAVGRANVGDILLLFIYLELGAMVGIYFETKRMPVRFLIYVAITALTRLMIDVINKTHDANLTVEPLLSSQHPSSKQTQLQLRSSDLKDAQRVIPKMGGEG